jgi:hypothetical protein
MLAELGCTPALLVWLGLCLRSHLSRVGALLCWQGWCALRVAPIARTICWEALGCTLALLIRLGMYLWSHQLQVGAFYAGRDESAWRAGRIGRHLLIGLGCTLGPADWLGRVLLCCHVSAQLSVQAVHVTGGCWGVMI